MFLARNLGGPALDGWTLIERVHHVRMQCVPLENSMTFSIPWPFMMFKPLFALFFSKARAIHFQSISFFFEPLSWKPQFVH